MSTAGTVRKSAIVTAADARNLGRLKADMRQAAKRRIARVDPNEQAVRHIERAKGKLRGRLCSEYWVGVVAGDPTAVWGWHRVACGTTYYPDAACNCARCEGLRKFPSPCVGSVGISYECWCDANAPRERSGKPKPMTEEQAIDSGLSVRDNDKPWRLGSRYIAGCEGCEGLRPVGKRYCLACAAKTVRDLLAAGWGKTRILAWCDGKDWPLEHETEPSEIREDHAM